MVRESSMVGDGPPLQAILSGSNADMGSGASGRASRIGVGVPPPLFTLFPVLLYTAVACVPRLCLCWW
jgi:hypothetical protein